MNKLFVTCSVAALWLLCASSATANIVPYNFNVAIDSGPLNGSSFSGSFSFDNVGLTGSGDESITLGAFTFTFESIAFTEADDPDPLGEGEPKAVFYDGDFLGISFFASTADFEFSFTPGFDFIEEAFFAYDIDAEGAGFGDIAFTVVPVPAAVWLFGCGLLGLIGVARRKVRI